MESKEIYTIKSIIVNHIAVMNICFKEEDENKIDYLKRSEHEVNGMLICLKNINEEVGRHYSIQKSEDGYEFGYYDEQSRWIVIEG